MSSQKNPFQKWKFLFFLLIGLFLSVCLTLLINSISLPSWLRPLVPLFLIALVALLILVEALKEDTPPHIPTREHLDQVDTQKLPTPTSPDRRAIIKRFILPVTWISLLTILGGYLTIEETNVENARDKQAKEKQAFDAQRNGQLTRLRIGFDPIGNQPKGTLDPSTLNDGLNKLLGMPVTTT